MSMFSRYVSSLLPGFKRTQVEEDLRILKESIVENTLPPYEAAAEAFTINKLASKDAVDFDRLFTRQMGRDVDTSGSYVHAIVRQLQNTVDVLDTFEKDLDKYFEKDITKAAMSYTHANVLKYIELATFNVRFARKLLLWTLQNEQEKAGQKIASPFAKAEIEWMLENRNLFLSSVKTLSMPAKKVTGLLKNIPNLVVAPEEADAVESSVGIAKIDPLGVGFIPVSLNPIYHIGMLVAEWQAERYKLATEEKRSLEYRLLSLKEMRDGKRDAKLEQEIEYTENRIKKINFKLSKFEEE